MSPWGLVNSRRSCSQSPRPFGPRLQQQQQQQTKNSSKAKHKHNQRHDSDEDHDNDKSNGNISRSSNNGIRNNSSARLAQSFKLELNKVALAVIGTQTPEHLLRERLPCGSTPG